MSRLQVYKFQPFYIVPKNQNNRWIVLVSIRQDSTDCVNTHVFPLFPGRLDLNETFHLFSKQLLNTIELERLLLVQSSVLLFYVMCTIWYLGYATAMILSLPTRTWVMWLLM